MAPRWHTGCVQRPGDPIERENDEIHRRVGARILHDPTVIAVAKARLDRWLARDPLPAWLEWKAALRMMTPTEIAEFLRSETPRARRMRCSSPFYGLAG